MYGIIFIIFIVKTEAIIQLNQIQNANWVLNLPYIDNQYINISNITCEQCLCQMLEMNNLTTSIVCQQNQMTCQLFFWNATAQLRIDTNSVVYFRPMPQFPQMTINQQSMTASINSEVSTQTTVQTSFGSTIMSTTQTKTTTWAETTAQSTVVSAAAPACSSAGHGNLAIFNGIPTSWTQYQYNYTANRTAHTIMFGFKGNTSGKRFWFLDDVSVVAVTAPNTELLQNPSFENSTTALTSWIQYCTSTCPSGSINGGQVVSGTNCSTNNCYMDHCYGSSAIDFLSQTFSATIGHVYTISFWIIDFGSGVNGATKAYADIY